MARIAAVVPVYFADDSLGQLHSELIPVLSRISDDYYVVYVDDGSPDSSWERIASLAATDARVAGLRLIRNYGEHVAISAGLDHVDADYVVVIACDLQDDPAAIPEMMRHAENGADLVLARRIRRRDPIMKRALARLFYAVVGFLVNIKYDYRVGNFRLVTRRALDYFRSYRERSRNVSAIMALMGVRTSYVDVQHRPRRHGRSNYTFWRSLKMAADVVLDYSHIPLLFSAALGLVLLVVALVAMVMAFTAWGRSAISLNTPGVVLAITFIGGLVLLNLGIVGAYIGRSATEARRRPLYFVERTAGRTARYGTTPDF